MAWRGVREESNEGCMALINPCVMASNEIYIVCDFIGCSGNDARGGYSSGVHSIIVGGW